MSKKKQKQAKTTKPNQRTNQTGGRKITSKAGIGETVQ